MASSVGSVKLGSQGLEVSPLGLGCMGMSMMYGNPPPEENSINLIHHAIHSGITFFDSSDVYGPHTNEILIGKAIQGMREKVQLATKFGIVVDKTSGYEFAVRGDPEYVRSSCEASLKRLGVDYIDLYYQHRVDTNVPIEVTVGAMKKLVEEGKVKYIGLSEASASTIRRAHAVHPISAVQIEWSLWSRDVEQDIIPTCKELGIGIVPYSPLGRGFLSLGRKIMEGASDKDYRMDYQPRLAGDNLDHNEALFQKFSRFASKKGCTPGQLALAWVRHQGIDCVVPIPGTTKVKNLDENVGTLSVKLSKEELQEIEILFPHESVAGSRYSQEEKLTFLNSETPPLSTWQGDS